MTHNPPCPDARFWLYHGTIPAVLFFASVLLFALTPLDIAISDRWFDFDAQRWIFDGTWWADELIHDGGRGLIVVVASLLLIALTLSFTGSRFRAWRRRTLYLCLAMALSTGSIAWIKHESEFYCPWDVDRYGGFAPHLGWWDPLPAGLNGGHCFPAGHASAGYALFGLYFVGRERSRIQGYLGLATALLLGSAFALGQTMRGAHFMSHNVWTAAICWAMALVLYQFAFHGSLAGRPRIRNDLPS